jgi:hypothetical protein
MISFFILTLNCFLCFLIIQLITTDSLLLYYLHHNTFLELSTSCIMPVTMRLQSKRFTTCLSESSMTSNSFTTNISIINNYPSNTTLISENVQQFDMAAASTNTLGIITSSSAILDSSSFSVIDTLDISNDISKLDNVGFQNLKPTV